MYYIISDGVCRKENITFTKQELYEAVDTSYKDTVIMDEGLAVLFSREAMRREGVEVQGLLGETRQRNLCLLVCIWDLLSLDSMTVRMLNFIANVTDGEEYRNGKQEMYKGNMEIWLNTKKHNYVLDYLRWLRNKWTNPQYAKKRPRPQIRVPGSVYREHMGPDGRFVVEKEGFYCVDRAWYKERKEQVRKRHKSAFNRKPPNRDINFGEMDKLLKSGMRTARIAEILNTSQRVVQMRKKEKRGKRSARAGPARKHAKK